MSQQTISVTQLFAQAAMEVNGKKLEGLTPETVIARLGLDSVAVMELVSYFEEKLSIRMPDEDLANVQTIADLTALVKRLAPPTLTVNN